MPLTPMSRDSMLTIKAKNDEADRRSLVDKIVTAIYRCAISIAARANSTMLQYPLQRNASPQQLQLERGRHAISIHQQPQYNFPDYVEAGTAFYTANMPDILSNLQELFPGCSVTHTNLTMGHDGNMYDISKLDESVKPFINQQASREYIVIDWS